jgi:hypothetical protein
LPMSRSYSVTADLTSQKVNGHRKNSLQQPTGHTFFWLPTYHSEVREPYKLAIKLSTVLSFLPARRRPLDKKLLTPVFGVL